MMTSLKEKYNTIDKIPQDFRNKFRFRSLPLMKWANILTFNTRAIALYISCLIDLPWLYIAFEIFVMTALYLYMQHTHEGICKKLRKELKS